METLIIWIAILAIGAVFEWVKKKDKPVANKQANMSHPSRPAPFKGHWEDSPQFHNDFHVQSLTNEELTLKDFHSNDYQIGNLRIESSPIVTQWPKAKTTQTAEDTSKHAKPRPAYQPLANLPEEGEHIEVMNLDEEDSRDNATTSAAADNDHYDRWRKAIIDTQILQRKF